MSEPGGVIPTVDGKARCLHETRQHVLLDLGLKGQNLCSHWWRRTTCPPECTRPGVVEWRLQAACFKGVRHSANRVLSGSRTGFRASRLVTKHLERAANSCGDVNVSTMTEERLISVAPKLW